MAPLHRRFSFASMLTSVFSFTRPHFADAARLLPAVLTAAGLLIPASPPLKAAEGTPKSGRSAMLDFNGYYDSRDYSIFTLNLMAGFSDRIHYFALINFSGDGAVGEPAGYYSEHNVRYKLTATSPLDLTAQLTSLSGPDNDNFKPGIRWRLNNTSFLESFFKAVNLQYSINVHLLQAGFGQNTRYLPQLEHVYFLDILPRQLDRRVYISGFIDQNIDTAGDLPSLFTLVTEHQLGLRIVDVLYFVSEYRYHGFLPVERHGLAIGLEYRYILKP